MKTRFITAVAQLEFSEQIRGENEAPGEKAWLCVWLLLPTRDLSFKDSSLFISGRFVAALPAIGTQPRPGLRSQLYK